MKKEKIKWLIILILAISSLLVFGLINRNVILGKKMEIEKLELRVDEYVNRIDPNLKVADIFIYSDSDYYFSIEEEDTGKGAMELLVNPYTGAIRPEQGPFRMWNNKYGMHGRGYGMMGIPYYYNDDKSITKITRNDAIIIANEYIQNNINTNYNVLDEGHEFYGYFTFHVEYQENTVGMISVNYYTGEVWYHDWHGTLINIISSHNEE